MTEHVDTLVVGAGPTGLMLATQLARRGIRTRIIDRNPGPSIQTKALGVQARTLEIYSHLGIAEHALELGTRATGAALWVAGHRAARVPLGDIGRGLSPYPFLLILGQDDNERLLGNSLRENGINVDWGCELTGLTQTPDHAVATVRFPDGSQREIHTNWLAGCDGARSTVRSLSGIPFVGAPYEHVFYVADTVSVGTMSPDELNVFLWRGGFHLFFPMRGTHHWRIVGILPPNFRDNDNLSFDDVVPAIRAQSGVEFDVRDCRWFSTYRIHHRRAERFSDRRCFLLGDAAHIHSPVGAQGMNTGLQDAYNLAWKLALVASGRADRALLDSYSLEREPVAERLLRTTDRAFALIVSERPVATIFRTRLFPAALALAMRLEASRRLAFRTISQIGIRYPQSPLSHTPTERPDAGVRPGDRFPWMRLHFAPSAPPEDIFQRLDDTRLNLILFGPPATADLIAACGDLIRIHAPTDHPHNDDELRRNRIPKPSYFLLRPDGHVGLVGTQPTADAVTRYLLDRLRIRPVPTVPRQAQHHHPVGAKSPET